MGRPMGKEKEMMEEDANSLTHIAETVGRTVKQVQIVERDERVLTFCERRTIADSHYQTTTRQFQVIFTDGTSMTFDAKD